MLASFPSFTLTAFSRNWPAPWKERKPEAMTFNFPCKSAEKDEGTHFSSLLFVLTKKRNLCACDTNQWFLLLLLLLAVLLNHHVHVLCRSPRHICLCKSKVWLMGIFDNTIDWYILQYWPPHQKLVIVSYINCSHESWNRARSFGAKNTL